MSAAVKQKKNQTVITRTTAQDALIRYILGLVLAVLGMAALASLFSAEGSIAFRLIRERGHEALTARSLASALGCSTQPIMYQFPNLDELRELTYQKADVFHTEYLLAAGDILEMGLRYVRFAKEEPQLFRFLFQSLFFMRSHLWFLNGMLSNGLSLP